jgi:hypothetical protein
LSFFLEKQHPRDKRVQRAQEEINAAIGEIFNKYELSYGEVFHILSEYMSICAEVMMDKERQGTETRTMCPVCGEPEETCKCRHTA